MYPIRRTRTTMSVMAPISHNGLVQAPKVQGPGHCLIRGPEIVKKFEKHHAYVLPLGNFDAKS
jgi:hypothetical protein